jgi:hypothetical protein
MAAGGPFDVKELIGEVAKRHHILLSEDDPVLVTLTLNELILTRAIAQIEAHIEACKEQVSIAAAEHIAASKALAEDIVTAGAAYLAGELRAAVAEATATLREAVAQSIELQLELPSDRRGPSGWMWFGAFVLLAGAIAAFAMAAMWRSA